MDCFNLLPDLRSFQCKIVIITLKPHSMYYMYVNLHISSTQTETSGILPLVTETTLYALMISGAGNHICQRVCSFST